MSMSFDLSKVIKGRSKGPDLKGHLQDMACLMPDWWETPDGLCMHRIFCCLRSKTIAHNFPGRPLLCNSLALMITHEQHRSLLN